MRKEPTRLSSRDKASALYIMYVKIASLPPDQIGSEDQDLILRHRTSNVADCQISLLHTWQFTNQIGALRRAG